jgi:GNAT superfamily N-acetyltransferase
MRGCRVPHGLFHGVPLVNANRATPYGASDPRPLSPIIHGSMAIEIRPATVFEDVKTMVGPKQPDANVCWCLSYRIPSNENRELTGPARGERVKQLIEEGPLGVLAYDGDEVVGWAAVAPRADTSFARNRKIPHVDDVAVWSVWCIRVRPGHRGKGISHHLLRGAVEFARKPVRPRSRAIRSTTGARRLTSRWLTLVPAGSSSGPGSRRRPTPTRC